MFSYIICLKPVVFEFACKVWNYSFLIDAIAFSTNTQSWQSYCKNRDGWKLIAGHVSVHIYNAQTKDIQHKSMVKPVLKAEGYTSRSVHSIASY